MRYNLVITEQAEKLLDRILHYIINHLKNPQAAGSLMDEINHIYNNLESNPKMYAFSEDSFLKSRGYRKAVVSRYDYVVVFRIEEKTRSIYIVGFFHSLELYKNKLFI